MEYSKTKGASIGVGMLVFFIAQFAFGTLLTFAIGLPIAILIMVTMQLLMTCPKCNAMMYDAANDPSVESMSYFFGFLVRIFVIPVRCNSCGTEF